MKGIKAVSDPSQSACFPQSDRDALYRVIYARRDVRSGFRHDAIPTAVLRRVLDAAHHSGSVGFMQPWNFLVVTDVGLRRRVRAIFDQENQRAAANFSGERRVQYDRLKLEGILDCGANICVTCDRERHGPSVLGRNTMRDTDLYSTCCAVQNLWLAARAEGLGVGWVSILDPSAVKLALGIPNNLELVAYLCIGFVDEFALAPDLERAGWQRRLALDEVAFQEQWGQPLPKE